MTVYIIFENLDDYPENGGGLQGAIGVYDSQQEAEKICALLNASYNEDGYGYYTLPFEVNKCDISIPQPKSWLDYWYAPYDATATEFNEQARKLAENARTGKVEINEKY